MAAKKTLAAQKSHAADRHVETMIGSGDRARPSSRAERHAARDEILDARAAERETVLVERMDTRAERRAEREVDADPTDVELDIPA